MKPPSNIVGREREIKILEKALKSKESEFIAIYGRRRVGKTYLIRQYFKNQKFFLETSGAKDKPKKTQIANFMHALSSVFFNGISLQTPSDWDGVFEILTKELKKAPSKDKIIIFLDELPWMATKKSGLLQSIDYYWNMYWSRLPNLILIACGSAASWMLDKLILAKGGLHKRITQKILLEPFSLKETKEFLLSNSIKLNDKQILDIYMAIGGVPYYLKAIERGMTSAQNIDSICFQKNGLLYKEFTNLFESLFDQAHVNLTIVKAIVKNGNEISRETLIRLTGISSGGTLHKRMSELESSGFVKSFVPFGLKQKDHHYRVIDEFSLFYLQWIDPLVRAGVDVEHQNYWNNIVNTPAVATWSGYAFENVCLKHISQIGTALGLSKTPSKASRWHYYPKKGAQDDGAEVDLLFDRMDGAITLCEIKYSEKPFLIDKAYGKQLLRKIDVFQNKIKTSKQIFLAMVTTCGLKHNLWSEEIVNNEVTLADLFRL